MKTKRLQLRYFDGRSAEVIGVTWYGCQEFEEVLGRVFRYTYEEDRTLWSAESVNGINHGENYIDKWSAAKQLALGLGRGEYVNG